MMILGKVFELNKDKKAGHEIDLLSSDSILDNLFSSHQATLDFKKKYFQKQTVVSRNNNIENVKEMLLNLDIQSMLKSSASDQIHVWLKQIGVPTLASITTDDSSQAYKLYCAGHSLYCRAPSEIEKVVVPRMLSELGMGISASSNDRFRRGEIETFYSRKGHITGFHTDFQENFTIQLTGSKKWTFSSSTAVHPVRGCTPHFNDSANNDVTEQQLKVLQLADPSFCADQYLNGSALLVGAASTANQQFEVELFAGDVMYHPAGVWHKVECTEDSISINISLTATSYADLFCSSIHQLLSENPRWRSPVITNDDINSHRGGGARTVVQSILRALPTVLQGLTASDILPTPCLGINDLSALNRKPSAQSGGGEDNDGFEEASDEEDGDGDKEGGSDDESVGEREKPSRPSDESVVRVDGLDYQGYFERWFDPEDEVAKLNSSDKKKRLSESEVLQRYLALLTKSCSFKFNPLAIVEDCKDLVKCGAWSSSASSNSSSAADGVYVVHCGFGNETLESLSRVAVVVSAETEPAMAAVMARYKAMRLARVGYYLSHDTTRNKGLKEGDKAAALSVNRAFSLQDITKDCGQSGEESSSSSNKKQKVEGDSALSAADVSTGDSKLPDVPPSDPRENVVRLLFALHAAGAITVNNL